jgi:hypothetical protein
VGREQKGISACTSVCTGIFSFTTDTFPTYP